MTDPQRGPLAASSTRKPRMSDDLVGLVLAVALTAYLVYALVFPERL